METGEGILTAPCAGPAAAASKRFAELLPAAGLTIFARVDHAANALAVGLTLRPMELFVFGNPLRGTALMQDRPTAGLDLPFRALIWEDAAGRVWLSYDDPLWIGRRHDIGPAAAPTLEAVAVGMAKMAAALAA